MARISMRAKAAAAANQASKKKSTVIKNSPATKSKVTKKTAKPKVEKASASVAATKQKGKSPGQQQQNQKTEPVVEPVNGDANANRRSSDRRKVAVDRFGLTFFFVPPKPKSPISTNKPSTTPSKKADSTSLNASSSKSLKSLSGKTGGTPKSKPSTSKASASKKATTPKATTSKSQPAPSSSQKGKKTAAKGQLSAKPAKKSATSTNKSISNVVNAVSSKQLDKADDEADLELGTDSGGVKVPPKSKKRKQESTLTGGSEKKIMKTIEDVVARVIGAADNESDEGKGKASPDVKKKGKEKDKSLKPKPQLKQYFHEPTFESKDELPFVSVPAYSKLAIRAVLINNENLLKRLIDDVQHVHNLNYERSVDIPYDAASYALFNGNAKLLQMLIDDEKKPKNGRVEPVRSLLGQQTTGQFNFHMLGHAVRQIQMSRGGKEGVNALTKDVGSSAIQQNWLTRLTEALHRNIPFRLIQQMQLQNVPGATMVNQRVYEAVRYGNNKLAGSIIKEYGGGWFNELHQQVLLNDNEPLKPFKAISVKKKGNMNNDITPYHCACINPNDKYLAALMAVEFDYNHADKNGYRPIHYAAACTSTAPMKLLLQKGAQPSELTKEGENALHRACVTGRAHNVDLILQHCKSSDTDLSITKQRSRSGFAPLHLAAKNGHIEAVKAMVKSGGAALDLDITSGPRSNAVTALMLAAQQGHLPVVEYLIKEAGASSTKLDKLKRSALAHAIINGMTHVASFLLRWGLDPDAPDSSGNTPTHYAAAYGWYFCLKMLIDAGAKLNAVNDWQLTPLAVAYMKGHMALADLLLQQPGIDINCRDDQGMTLVASTLLGSVDDSTIDQLNYLIKDKGADPTPADTAGNTPLHLLAAASLEAKPGKNQRKDEANAKLSIDVAKLLIEKGVNADVVNDTGETAMSIAVEAGKLPLAKYLTENGPKLSPSTIIRLNKSNLIHHLIERLVTIQKNEDDEEEQGESTNGTAALDIFNLLLKSQHQETLERLKLPNTHGLTPFLLAVSKYGSLKDGKETEPIKANLREFINALLNAYPAAILQRSGKLKSKDGEETVEETDEENKDADDANDEDEEKSEEKSSKDDEEEDDDEEEKAEEERKRKKAKVELNDGRSALHLLASSQHQNTDDDKKTVDALLDLLLKHIKEYKDSPKDQFLDAVDGRGETALFAAVKNRRSNVALHLMEMGCNVNCIRRLPPSLRPKTPKKDSDGTDGGRKKKRESRKEYIPDLVTMLMAAVRVQLTNVFEGLLKAGADVHASDSDGDTALHYACMMSPSNVTMVRLLLEAGANFEARNQKLRTPLHLACNADTGATDVSTETLSCLLNYGADPFVKDIRNRMPLHYAFVKIGDHENYSDIDPVALCTVLLPRMAGQPQSLNSADSFGCTPLHCAAKRGANICCMTLLRNVQVDKNAKDNHGNTPLAIAVLHDHVACALTLIQAEADVNVTVKGTDDDDEETDQANVMKWTPIVEPKVENPALSLSSVVVNREWQGVVYLLIDIFNKKKQPLLPLLEAAVEHRKYNLSLTLIRMAKNHIGSTSLGPAQLRPPGKKNLFHLLADNQRPSTEIGVQLQLDVAEAILDYGVPIDEHRDDATGPFHPAFYAAKRRNVPLLKFFFEKGPKTKSLNNNVISSSGHSILTMYLWDVPIAETGTEETQFLDELKAGHGFSFDALCRYPVPADWTATDPSLAGYWTKKVDEEMIVTPLIHAIHGRSFHAVKNLINAGSDVNLADAKGITPLMHAVRMNEPDIVKLLLNFDHCMSQKTLVHKVEIYKAPGEEDDEEEDEDEDEEEEENESDEDDGDGGTNYNALGKAPRKQLGILKAGKAKAGPKKRKFNVKGSMAVPASQRSIDDPAAMAQLSKKGKVDSTKKKFNKTSAVNLNAIDSDNRNVLHHVVAPFDFGGWLKASEILEILIDLGADHKKKDRAGMTPFDYAKRNGQLQLADELGEQIDEFSANIDPKWNVGKADDGRNAVAKVGSSVKVGDDAKEYLAKVRQKKAEELERNKAATADAKKAKRLRPHRSSGYADIGEIVVDTSGGVRDDGTNVEPQPYDVLLNKVDFQYGLYGFYNFYRMQLIRRKGSDLYIVFTNWGRIGDEGQYQKTPFGKLPDAVKEFKSIFRAKTGNDWSADIVKKFSEQPKKYRLINKEEDEKLEESSTALDVPIVLETPLKSSLPVHLQKFMADVANVDELTSSAKRVFQRSRFDLTVTALKREAVLRADSILNEIGDKLKELEKLRQNAHDKEKLEAGTKIYQELGNLSTEFYFLLPLRGFERSRLPMIDDLQKWSEYKSAVELLLKYEIANHLLCAAAGRKSEFHPYDYIYSAVGARMERLKNDDRETQFILHYIHNTAENPPKVMAVYKVWNDEHSRRYREQAEKIGNRWLMWHGTKAPNVLSILQAGLMVAPPQALHTGHLFGRGIYVADSFEKSSGYCEASMSGRKFAFLCEVALGKIARMWNISSIDTSVDPLPDGYDSVQGTGRSVPNPLYDFTLKNGVKVPLGCRIEQEIAGKGNWGYWLQQNEFIVYNPNQISLRYLVMFK